MQTELNRKLSTFMLALSSVAILALTVPGRAALEDVTPTDTANEEIIEPAELVTTERHRQIADLVTQVAEHNHYARKSIDNKLSSIMFDNYLEALDGNHSFFLQSDIDRFEKYRYTLDDSLRAGNMRAVFDVFDTYRQRAATNYEYAISLLDQEPDFTVDESYVFDRAEMAWPQTEADMQELWRQRVKSEMLTLVLAEGDEQEEATADDDAAEETTAEEVAEVAEETQAPWQKAAETLSKRYERYSKRIGKMDSDDVFEGFISTFAQTLDPHSNYLSPRQSDEYRIQMSLAYQGIGASLQLDKDDIVTVLDVIPGGPASIDGTLKATDKIIAVAQGQDGEMVDVIGWMLDDVVQLIRGPADTVVELRIRPGSTMPGEAEYTLSLTRNEIKLEEQAAKSEVIDINRDGEDYSIGVIYVPSFYQDFEKRNEGKADYNSTTRDVERLIAELQEQEIDGLVMDLRGNGGGHLSEATALSGLFIGNGPVVQLRDTTDQVNILEDPKPSRAYAGPLVVLVDRFSASASEIFAAAIQDYNRGIVIGQQTFGKGTVQNLYELDEINRRILRNRNKSDEKLGQLTLTIGKYYRVTGGSTQNRGVIPDIQLPSLVDTDEFGENTKPGALPWDQINPTRFRAQDSLDSRLSELMRSQIQRSSQDPDFQYLLQDIEAIDQLRQQKAVSLNLETRRTEQEQRRQARLDRENSRRSRQGLEPLDSLASLDEEELPDVLLNQAAEVLADMAGAQSAPAVLSQTDGSG